MATIYGTAYSDNNTYSYNGSVFVFRPQINGTGFDDQIYALAGNDLVYANNGNDYVDGWEGNDSLYGGWGDDALVAWKGNDILYGEADNDWLDGAYDHDILYGGDGNDTLGNSVAPEPGNDKMYGEGGNDRLYGGDGNDTLSGGGYFYNSGEVDTLTGNGGADRFVVGTSSDYFYLGLGHAMIADFKPSEGDRLQLKRESGNNVYTFYYVPTVYGNAGVWDTLIYMGNDLMAVLQDAPLSGATVFV